MEDTRQARWERIVRDGEPSLVDIAADQADDECALDGASQDSDRWFAIALAAYAALTNDTTEEN